MSLESQKNYAKSMGFSPLGENEIEVQIPLLEEEKIQLGKSQSLSLMEIRRLEAEFAKIKLQFKNEIDAHKIIIDRSSEMLSTGSKKVRRNLPCFLDPLTRQKHWVDLETGEIVASQQASQDDMQAKMFEGTLAYAANQ